MTGVRMTETSLASKLKAHKPESAAGVLERFTPPAYLKPDATSEEKTAAAAKKKTYDDTIQRAFVDFANGSYSDVYLALQPIFDLQDT